MLLQKLIIKGFKSFGDKAVVDFNTGVTGIVGPNGCGKSNVVDSIRWVLGEQKTRALRSDKMENVIFNGTKNRKSAQYAEVSLTFANDRNLLPAEYTTLTVTRRYYRSGDSDYLINGVTCRLRDINDLFLDTGIGSDSYAIIELGMVDEILNDREQSRRKLFEKAAGVSKFKKRKKEALSQLQSVDTDLERVQDLQAEIAKNLRSLERQAKQAEKFFRLKKEYQNTSVALARKSIKRQREEHQTLSEKIKVEQENKQKLRNQIFEQERSLQEKKEALLRVEKHLSEKQKLLNAHQIQLRNLENERKLQVQRMDFASDKSNSLSKQIEQSKGEKESLEQKIQQIEAQKVSAEKQWNEVEMTLQNIKEEYDLQKAKTQEIQQKVSAKQKQYQEKQNATFQLNKNLEIKQSQLSNSKQELEQVVSEDSKQNALIQNYAKQVAELEFLLEQKQENLAKVQREEENREAQINQINFEIEALREDLREKNRILDAKKNEYNLSKSLLKNMEGFPEAIKFLSQSEDWESEKVLLSDIISAPAEYRVAIENYLEPYLNFYVVENELQAFSALHLLDKHQKGKASFLINNEKAPNPKGEQKSPQPQRGAETPNSKPALEIVKFEEKYANLVHYLLGNVFVLEHEKDYNLLHPDFVEKTQANFVSKDGKIIQRNFVLSGGAVGDFEGGKISRKQNLETLAEVLEGLEKDNQELRNVLKERQGYLQDLKAQNAQNQIRALQKENQELEKNLIALETKKEQIENLVQSNTSKQDLTLSRISELEDELQNFIPKLNQEQQSLKDIEEDLEILRENLALENEVLAEKSERYNQQNIQVYQKKNTIENLEREATYSQENFEKLANRIVQYEKELAELQKNSLTLQAGSATQDKQLAELQAQSPEIETAVEDAEKQFYQLRANIQDEEQALKRLQKQKEDLDFILQQLHNQLNEVKLALTSVKERLSGEFHVDLDQLVLEEEDSEFTEKQLKEQTQKLREQIEKIGTVNPMAMESFKEMKERSDFIQTQRSDLETAKKNILKTINETENYAKEVFLDAYLKIRTNFIQVFRSLFSEEDTADLILSDPENPLESKIEIVAKPKGKRPLTINQLSGGEKTLTATSLLFALYLLKPAPFCIFDEVDAPLDDANTDKFNRIIRDFSKDSQFIIVTHNKRTMTQADILYGVTMHEQGVSRLVPVDLRSLE